MTPFRCKHAVEAMSWSECPVCFGEGSYLEALRGSGGELRGIAVKRCTCIAGLLNGRARLDDNLEVA